MFDRLTDGFAGAFRRLSGRGTITEANVRETMDDVRTSLLEADVQVDVANDFCEEVIEDAIGRDVTRSLKPGQEMVGIVHERLVELLGGSDEPTPGVMRITPGPTVVMLCGLQGSGKTTTCAKIAAYLKKRGRSVMLCAADLQRPAAVDQLQIVAEQVATEMPGGARVTFYSEPDKTGKAGAAVGVCKNALRQARDQSVDTLILDTAGRLHIDKELMGELRQIDRALSPHEIFLVVDAMTGQDAVTSAKAFHEQLSIDGVVLTKFDSDTRGGAVLSVKRVTGAPIRFIGVGEKLDAIEEFHPDRMAQRILGMGDIVSLVEKAQDEVTEEEAEALQQKMAKGEMTMDDFVRQLRMIRRMGPLKNILGLMPGIGSAIKDVNVDDAQFDYIEATVSSMTADERKDPNIITTSRRKRIAKGSGTSQQQVTQLVKQFSMMTRMSRQMAGMSSREKARAVRGLQGEMQDARAGGDPAAALAGFRTKGSTKSRTMKRRPKNRKR